MPHIAVSYSPGEGLPDEVQDYPGDNKEIHQLPHSFSKNVAASLGPHVFSGEIRPVLQAHDISPAVVAEETPITNDR